MLALATMDYNRWETFTLRDECTHRRLSIDGNKFGLVQRLVNDDVEKRRAKVYTFDSMNDPEGAEERRYIEEEFCFKQWAHFTVKDAEHEYHTRKMAKAIAEKRTGAEALIKEREEALRSVENRVKGLPPKNTGEDDDAMDVDPMPMVRAAC